MTKYLRFAILASVFAAVVVSHAPPASAQQGETFDAARLEQLVAPIALYPDSLLTQVLMASTYPLEVVEAARWVQANPGLSPDSLDEALKNAEWDPSVKSLCPLPDVLNLMNENLQWTQDLGDAFLAQASDVLGAVQKMRNIAYEAGNLRNSEQQRVTVQDRVVVIQPASPEVIYVPVYSPRVVYGPSWGYPSYYYPSFYVAPPPGYALFSFGVGVAIGAALWGDCDWGHWHGHGYSGGRGIYINRHNYDRFNGRTNRDWHDHDRRDDGGWTHDPGHRRGVDYRSPETARRFGTVDGSRRPPHDNGRDFGGPRPGGPGSDHNGGPRPGSPGGDRIGGPRPGGPGSDRDGAPASRFAPRPGVTGGDSGRGPSRDPAPRPSMPAPRIDNPPPRDPGVRPPRDSSLPRSGGGPSGQRSPGVERPPSMGGGPAPSRGNLGGNSAPRGGEGNAPRGGGSGGSAPKKNGGQDDSSGRKSSESGRGR